MDYFIFILLNFTNILYFGYFLNLNSFYISNYTLILGYHDQINNSWIMHNV